MKRRVKTRESLSRERNIIKVLKETHQDQHVVPALVVVAEAAQEVRNKEEEEGQMGLLLEVVSEEVTDLKVREADLEVVDLVGMIEAVLEEETVEEATEVDSEEAVKEVVSEEVIVVATVVTKEVEAAMAASEEAIKTNASREIDISQTT
jgi:hypothetical protein